ncbi:MAG: atoS [Microvirga sp.]|jgi:two-component sensor histidine kinase|nr:atoS [Microvirga sp.]
MLRGRQRLRRSQGAESQLRQRTLDSEGDLSADEVERRTGELRAELELQRRRFREMGHRVRNSLQTLSALSLLKARRTEDESARRALLNMAQRIAALSTAYRMSDPSSDEGLDAGALIAEIATELAAGAEGGQVALALDLSPIAVPLDAAAPLALLVNELIGLALRGGAPEGSPVRLTVSAGRRPEGTCLAIACEGLLASDAELSGDTFGRTLCEMFARQIKAELTFDDAGSGTRAVVLLPSG